MSPLHRHSTRSYRDRRYMFSKRVRTTRKDGLPCMVGKKIVTSGFLRETKNVFEDLTLYRPTHMRMNRLVNRIVHSRSSLESKGPDHGEMTTIQESRRMDSRTGIKEITMPFGIHNHSGVMKKKESPHKAQAMNHSGFADGHRLHSMGTQEQPRR